MCKNCSDGTILATDRNGDSYTARVTTRCVEHAPVERYMRRIRERWLADARRLTLALPAPVTS